MFFFRHPKPVVDPRPVAEQSMQVKAVALPALTELVDAAKGEEATSAELDVSRPAPAR